MVVRRRTGLVAGIAVGSAALGAAYLWSFAADASWVTLVVGLLLGVVAVVHGLAWTSARTPLLVADDTGLRVRLGPAWTGVPWDQVERVEVQERGPLRDGRVAVQVADEDAALAGAGRLSRFAAWSNAKLYGARLAVPYGLATSVTAADVAGELTRLAAGRAAVVVPGDEPAEPAPTVEIAGADGSSPTAGGDDVDTVELPPVRPAEPVESVQEAPDEARAAPPTPPAPVAPPAPRAPGVAARETVVPLPLRRVVSAFRSHPARREEVTIAMRGEATDGTLALSARPEDVYTDELPEIAELRRRDESSDGIGTVAGGNIALIIDATTDLSARAMRKVRNSSPPPGAVADTETDHGDEAVPADDRATLRIGGQLRQARETLGLSVDELAERTRIRPFVIECMEADDFSPCGGDFYARGHLRMLARVLGIAPDPLLQTYDEAFATSPVGPRAVFDVELATGATGMVRGGAPGANWGGLIAAVLVLVLVWGVARFFADGVSPAPAAPAPTQNSSGLGSPGVGNTPIPPPPDAHVKLTATGGASRVVVRNRFRDVVFEGVLRAGRSKKVAGESPLRVFAADAGVVSLSIKGRSLGKLGSPGEPATERITAGAGEITGRAGGSDRSGEPSTDRRMATPRVPSDP